MAPLLLQQPLFAAPTLPALRRGRSVTRPFVARGARASLADFGDLADPTQRPSKVEAAYRRLRGDRPAPVAKAARALLPQSPSRAAPPAAERGAATAETARAAEGDRLAPGIALLLLLWAVGGSALDTKLSQSILSELGAEDEADLATSADGDSAFSFAALRAPPPAASSTAAACDPVAAAEVDDEDEFAEEEQDTLPLFLGALSAPLLVLAARGELKTDKLDLAATLTALASGSASAEVEPQLTMRAPRVTPRAPRRPLAAGAAARSAAAEARLQAQREETSRMVKAKLAARNGVGAPGAGASDDALRRWWNTWWRDNMSS